MIELLLLANLWSPEPTFIPGQRVLNGGVWLAFTRSAPDCAKLARDQGYSSYLWTPELQPAEGRLHVTGQCFGLGQRNYKVEALEYEINRGNN